ncbi:energy transducer TonB [Chryseolinea sp. T2]|uniref:energy transducer TonB n=1 Tax=Chryseolinea sp. T2 TaxID=3129255 RepID=UPI0030788BA8
MKRIKLATLILILATGTIFGQSDLCFDNAAGTYWPIKVGTKIKYSSRGESYTSYFNGDSLRAGDKYYLKEIEEYANGKTKTSYWREENGVVYFYDSEKKAESIELINNLTPGTTWEKYDRTWKYTIIDTASSFATPFCEFKNLLQVKAEPQNEIKDKMYSYYNLFYKRGVGMIGMNVNGEAFIYAKPNKEINEKNFIAYGCEKLASIDEQRKCTYSKISEFFSKEFQAPKKKDFKTGTIVLNVVIGKDGVVDDIKVIETIAGAKNQEEEAIRVLKRLPKMIPAQVDDGQQIRSSFKFPIKF